LSPKEGQQKAPDNEPAKQEKAADPTPAGVPDRTTSSPIPAEKWNFEYAEKTWGIKLKQVKYVQGDYWTSEYRILLEFTRDLTAEELALIKPTDDGRSRFVPQNVAFVILDEESVPIGRIEWSPVSADQMTGVKGDAFWVVCRRYSHDNSAGMSVSGLKGVKRVELRPTRR
jgi:hypothetical protein